MGDHRVQLGDNFRIVSNSSLAVTCRARVLVEFDNGRLREFNARHVTASDQSKTTNRFGNMEADGRVVRAGLFLTTPTNVKRGQTFISLSVRDRNLEQQDILAQDYLYGLNDLVLGRFLAPGPGGGNGFVQKRQIADDIQPADIEHSLGVANTLRRIDGFLWYFNASSDVTTRTLRASIRDLGGGLPTGMTSGGNTLAQLWPTAGALSLTADQEGTMVVLHAGFAVTVDNGTTVHEDNTIQPSPFPYWADEDDVGEFFFDVANVSGNDRQSIYIIEESWLQP